VRIQSTTVTPWESVLVPLQVPDRLTSCEGAAGIATGVIPPLHAATVKAQTKKTSAAATRQRADMA
jgi:hypothetical protein